MFQTFAIAVSMSADAFAASLGKGAALDRPKLAEALRTACIFGTIETATPLIGWAIGAAASAYVAAIDHWIAFTLLGAIGLKMIWQSAVRPADEARPRRHSFAVLAATAIGTSIDALAIGVTLALLDAAIVTTALAIGLTTFCLTALGMMVGRLVGARLGRAAEALGGMLLLVIGTTILVEHLGLWP